ncbi:MAG: ATP-binding protein [Fimbriimonadaceae bacterium]
MVRSIQCADADVCVRSNVEGHVLSLLRSILGSTDYGVLVTDLDHVALACNRRFGELFGIDHKPVVESGVLAVRDMVGSRIPDLTAWSENLAKVYTETERVQEDLLSLRNPAATVRRFTGPVLGPDGTVIARIWTFLDVTAEHRRQLSSETLGAIALFHDLDPSKVYAHAVERVGEHYGSLCLLSVRDRDYLHFRAVGGPNAIEGISGNNLADSYCQFCLEAKQPVVIQDSRDVKAASGLLPATVGFTRYMGVPLNDPQGGIIGTLCILDERSDEVLTEDDIQFMRLVAMKVSAELERERQLESLRHDLEATSASLEQTQRKLVESEKLAVTGTLAASVAHDIRNILSAVRLEIEMGSDDPRSALGSVRDQLDRFSVLSARLLSYARPRASLHANFDLQETIEEVASLLHGHAKIHDCEIKTRFAETPHIVVGEAGQIELVLVNLVLNAVQAMPGGGTVTIAAHARKTSVEVEVQDTGTGVPTEAMERLFEPFSSSRAEGCGLGLYSCRRIAEDHGGSIRVRSTPGHGTTFTLTLSTS